MGGQGTKRRRNIAENFNRLSRAHERYRERDDRQTTDGRTTTYSERERELTFAKNNSRKPYLRKSRRLSFSARVIRPRYCKGGSVCLLVCPFVSPSVTLVSHTWTVQDMETPFAPYNRAISRIRAFEWYRRQWPWMTLNDVTTADARYLYSS